MLKTKVSSNGQKQSESDEQIKIKPYREKIIELNIVGISPYMQARFSQKAMLKIRQKHEQGSQAKKVKNREKRDFEQDYQEAMHIMEDGSHGIPASCFRSAMIDVCRAVDFNMRLARMSIRVLEDGFGKGKEKTPLIKLNGNPEMDIRPVRNQTGVCDLRARPLWKKWNAKIKIAFDEGQFSTEDVVNLMIRVGKQIGIGEGRPFSKESNGIGFGLFEVVFNNK